MPAVSVIIPTYNRAELLSQAIESVLAQSYRDFELIIVDDGSTDHTPDIVAGFDDARIRYHRQEQQERGAARNRGVALSRGEYLTFLDDDDWYLPCKLAVQVRAFQAHPNAGMVISGWERVDECGRLIRAERPWVHHPRPALQDWLFAAMAHVAAVLIRRPWFEQVGGFNHLLQSAEDTHLWFKLARAGCPIAWAKETVFRQRLHSANSLRNITHTKKGKTAMIDAVFADPQAASLLGVSKETAYARIYLGFACHQYAANSPAAARADLARAVSLDPTLLHHDADRLLESVAAYAWNHLTGEPLVFTNRVFSNLPPELSHLRRLRRRAISRTWMVGAFRAYQYADMARVRQTALRAIVSSPSSLRNRGLLAILLHAYADLAPFPIETSRFRRPGGSLEKADV